MKWVIYTLKNPRTSEVRYVGWTVRVPGKRLRHHINESLKLQQTHKQRWIMSLLSIGLEPVIDVIESGSGPGWQDAEIRWIAFYRATGSCLTNATDGGDGLLGCRASEERKSRIRAFWAALTPEERKARAKHARDERTVDSFAAISRATSASMALMTPEQRSANGKKGSDAIPLEKRSQAMAALMASFSPEQRTENARKAGKTSQANHSAEERRARMAHAYASRSREECTATALRNAAQMNAGLTYTQRSAARKKGWADTTPEERSAIIKRGHITRAANKAAQK